MPLTVFQRLASLVLVRDLQAPLGPQFSADQSSGDAFDLLSTTEDYDPMDRLSLVVKEDEVVGWVGLDMLETGRMVGECAERINPGEVLSADTPALEVVDLFACTSKHFFFVLDHSLITGTLHYEDLYGLPFRMCLLALTLDLEHSALHLLSERPGPAWNALGPPRQRKAESVYLDRYGHTPNERKAPLDRLLGCTTFCDKGTMVSRQRLLAGVSAKRIRSAFGRAEKVRNECAHTHPDEQERPAPIGRADLASFLHDVQALVAAIESAGNPEKVLG